MYTQFSVLIIIAVIICAGWVQGFIPCQEPPESKMGQFVTDSTGQNSRDSEVLIHELCKGMKNRTTESWIRGSKVKDICSTIPPNTAIATFAGKSGGYHRVGLQHSAIFISCSPAGLKVYDQSPISAGVRIRRLRYGGPPSVSNGNSYYLIL